MRYCQAQALVFAIGADRRMRRFGESVMSRVCEIKHTAERADEQFRHLVDPEKYAVAEKSFGRITSRVVYYRGPDFDHASGVKYRNEVRGLLALTSSLQPPRSSFYPLSIFPESEQRRIAADFGEPRLPLEVKRAIDGAEKAMARSRKRAEKGLCTKEESEAFCAKSQAALRNYLDKQVESGTITPAERKAVGR